MAGQLSSDAVRRAVALAQQHPLVAAVSAPVFEETAACTTVDVTFTVNLPSRWQAAGQSPSGVKANEIVTLRFPSGFPLFPLQLQLRADFDRDRPHVQPWLVDGRVSPCVYDGDLGELLQREGVVGVLNHTAVWLERAALETLNDPRQGWEPVRRDALGDYLVADAECLRNLVTRGGGYAFLGLEYLWLTGGEEGSVHGVLQHEPVRVNRTNVGRIFHERPLREPGGTCRGSSLGLVVWPGKKPSGDLIVCDAYRAEDVRNVGDLRERAEFYGCGEELETGLKWIGRCVSGRKSDGDYPLAIVLLARRPFNVIGSQSPIELCPYITRVSAPALFERGEETVVRPAGHRHKISPALLRQMSGVSGKEPQRWTLLGAGSLGSKLAIHLARAGCGPEAVVDRAPMLPHNAARHALIPPVDDMEVLWGRTKADLLAVAVRGLGQETKAVNQDIVYLLEEKGVRDAWSKRSWAVVNATASLRVREALAASNLVPSRVVEASLLGSGRVGMMTVEGPERNPNTGDLIAECYALLQKDAELRTIVFDGAESFSRQSTGEGCGSLTAVMSDSRLSLIAASMSEHLLVMYEASLPTDRGEVLIGKVQTGGLGLEWVVSRVPPVRVVSPDNSKNWRVRVHERASAKIETEVARWPGVETGGVLLGRLSEAAHTIHVVDTLEAPSDSIRSPARFVLGTSGLRQSLNEYSKGVDWALYCLGTWHSHPSSSGPSEQDREIAATVAVARVAPSTLLIHTREGFRALLADGLEITKGATR